MVTLFQLTIDCENDAFGAGDCEVWARETARILVATAQRLVSAPHLQMVAGTSRVHDVNGNYVGTYRVVREP